MILPDTGLRQAAYVAEVLRKKIANTAIKQAESDVSLSAIFGVASLRDNAKYIAKTLRVESIQGIYETNGFAETDWDKIEDSKMQISELLVKMADAALARAKHAACAQCGFTSEKPEPFQNDRCPACGSDRLMRGGNRVVAFETE